MGREQGMFSTAEEKQIVFFTNTKKLQYTKLGLQLTLSNCKGKNYKERKEGI